MTFDDRTKLHIIFIIAVAMFMEMLDASALNTSLPQIALSLHANPIQLKVAITTYLLTLGIFIPLSGWVVDRIGERNSLLIAISVFLASSIGCASSHNLTSLVIFRLLQGMGGAFLAPVGRLILVRVYGKENIVGAMARVSMISILALMLGPLLGGAITTYLSWRWIFWLNIPFGLFGIQQIIRYLPRLNPPVIKPFNFINFLLIGSALGLLLFFIDTIIQPLIPVTDKILLLITALTLAAAAFFHTKAATYPLLDFSVFRNRTFSLTALGSLTARFTLSTPPFLIPLMLQATYGFSALHSGLITVPAMIGALTSRKLVSTLINKFEYKRLLKNNSIILCIIFLSYSINAWHLNLPLLLIQQFLFGFCSAIQYTSMNSLAYKNLNDDQISRGTSIYSAVVQLSASFGIAIAALIMVATIGHNNLSHNIPTIAFKVVFVIQSIFMIMATFIFSRLRSGKEISTPEQPQLHHKAA